jgi:Acetyltransferase (GNAT) domain
VSTSPALLAPEDVTPEVEAAWRDLAGRAAEPNPCNEPDMLLPAMRHLPDGRRARLLVVTDGDRLDAVLPVLPVRRWRRRVPVPALVTWDHHFQMLGSPLVDADRATQALTAMLRAPWTVRQGAALLEIVDLGDGGPVAAALDEAAAAVGGAARRWDGFERAVLARTEDGTLVGDDCRERRRRARRGLERQAGPVASVDRSADPDALDRFLAMEASGWKGEAGTAIACDPAATVFFREVCRRFAAGGRLEVRSLDVSAGPVAMELVFHAGDGAFHLKTAYDERYRAHTPGILALVEYADRFAAESVGFRDICTGGPTEMEGRVWPGRRRISTVLTTFASPLSRAVVAGLTTARERRGRAA